MYKCTGSVTEWTKCQYITKAPGRKAFKVPKEYHDVDVFISKVFKQGAIKSLFGIKHINNSMFINDMSR
jgi:poly [ADP-ribose] polymerase